MTTATVIVENRPLLAVVETGGRGPSGQSGTRWFWGEGSPALPPKEMGASRGDHYREKSSGDIWVASLDEWVQAGSIRGPQGVVGRSAFAFVFQNGLQSDEDGFVEVDETVARVESPSFTGSPTATTPPSTDNSTRLATTAYVGSRIEQLLNAAPAAFDTLKEIADYIASDQSAAGAMNTAIAARLVAANNLSDVSSPALARGNLGLGALALLSAVGSNDIANGSVTLEKLATALLATQAQAEATSGGSAVLMTAERVRQAIAALSPASATALSSFSEITVNNSTLVVADRGRSLSMDLAGGVTAVNLPLGSELPAGWSVIIRASGVAPGFATNARVASQSGDSIRYRRTVSSSFALVGADEIFQFTWLGSAGQWLVTCLAQPSRLFQMSRFGTSASWNSGSTSSTKMGSVSTGGTNVQAFNFSNSAITVPVAGLYSCRGHMEMSASSGGGVSGVGGLYYGNASSTNTSFGRSERFFFLNQDYGVLSIERTHVMSPADSFIPWYYMASTGIYFWAASNFALVTLEGR